jgi:hypothetical protein
MVSRSPIRAASLSASRRCPPASAIWPARRSRSARSVKKVPSVGRSPASRTLASLSAQLSCAAATSPASIRKAIRSAMRSRVRLPGMPAGSIRPACRAHSRASPASPAKPRRVAGVVTPTKLAEHVRIDGPLTTWRTGPATEHRAVRCRIGAYLDQGGACAAAGPASAPDSALGGPPGARRAGAAEHADPSDSRGRQPGGARIRRPRSRLSSSQPPRLGRPAGVAARSASPNLDPVPTRTDLGACEGNGAD